MKTALILGAGAAGCAVAHQLSLAGGWQTTVLEAAPFSGAGIRTNWYAGHPFTFGPRHFLTKSEAVWAYMNEFCPLHSCADHEFKTFVPSDGQFWNFPINRDDIYEMPDRLAILDDLKQAALSDRIQPTNLEEFWLSAVGSTLYEKMIRRYNEKMWQMPARDIDTFRWSPKGTPLKTGPRAAWDDALSGYPSAPVGYNSWLDTCLADAEVHYNAKITNFDLENKSVMIGYDKRLSADIIISTLSPDILRWFSYGRLPYIGRDFHKIVLPIEFALPEHVYFTYEGGDEKWTRLTEYKKFTRHQSPHTLLSIEIPSSNGKHYPLPTLAAQAKARQYLRTFPKNVWSVGRSGTYRYEVDIAVCIEQAFALVDQLKNGWDHPIPMEKHR